LDEFWVCQHCRSLNRAGTGRCYHCRQKFGSKPKEAAAVVRNAATPGPVPFPPGAIGSGGPAGFGGPIGAAGPAAVGGAMGGSSGGDAPAYLSRPVALAPAPVRDFSAAAARAKPERQFRLPSLTGWIRRRIAWSLAARPFVPVWLVGYLAAGLLTLLLLDGALIVTTVIPVARVALESGSITFAWTQVNSGNPGALEAMAISFAVIGALALLFFSIFLGLSTHNAPGLGAEMPLLTPYRAGTCWLALLWAQARIAVGLLVPAALLWLGYPLPGLIAALVAVEVAQRRIDEPFGWLTRPARHLPDLFARLGVSGSTGSPIGTAWSVCFRTANVLAIVVYTFPILAFVIGAIAAVSGRTDLLVWPSSGTGPFQLAIAAVAGLLILTTSGAIGLLVPVSIELVDRQRTRRTLARVGRSRPWGVRPGNFSASAPDSGPTRYDPYERSNEREPYQASLNSPSTTSSFPWEDEVSEEAPPD
jgi:hypothetical protein